MDLDFILAEYDRCVPMALIDYKHEHGAINFQSANIRTLVALGDMAGLPSNDNNTKLSELVFVSWLYELRGRKIPQDIVDIITKH